MEFIIALTAKVTVINIPRTFKPFTPRFFGVDQWMLKGKIFKLGGDYDWLGGYTTHMSNIVASFTVVV